MIARLWRSTFGLHPLESSFDVATKSVVFLSQVSEMSDLDVELGHLSITRPARLEGYPSFAHFIARDGDAAIFRQYAQLSARNLLYLQSELHELEERLRNLDREDVKEVDNDEMRKAAREWRYYSDPNNGKAKRHKVLQKKITAKLTRYRACGGRRQRF